MLRQARNRSTSDVKYLLNSLTNLPMIIIRKAAASGAITNKGNNGFIFYPLKFLISLISNVPYFL